MKVKRIVNPVAKALMTPKFRPKVVINKKKKKKPKHKKLEAPSKCIYMVCFEGVSPIFFFLRCCRSRSRN